MGTDSGNCAIARHAIPKISFRPARTERFRTTMLQRFGDITDYLNWYEATDENAQAPIASTAKKRLADEGAAVHSATQN